MAGCHHHHHHADLLTNTAAVGDYLSSFVSVFYWFGSMADLVFGFEANLIGLSYFGIVFGSLGALFAATGATLAHRSLNTYHQPNTPDETSVQPILPSNHDPKVTFITPEQALILLGDFIAHTGDIAGPITFVVALGTGNNLPRWSKILVQCGASLFGGTCSLASVRTCKNAMVENQLQYT